MRKIGWGAGAALFVVGACSSTTVVSTGVQGSEGAPCYPNGSCNTGLVCESARCTVSGGNSDGGSGAPGKGGAGGRVGGGGTAGNGAGPATGGAEQGGVAGTSSAGGVTSVGGASSGGTSSGGAGNGGATGGSGPTDAGNIPTDCETIQFRTRASAAGDPFVVQAGASDLIQCFSFHVDTKGAAQVFEVNPSVTNQGGGVIKHLFLYEVLSQAQADGTTSPCLSLHPAAKLLGAWTHGAGSWMLPVDTGLDLASNDFLLEAHYDNPGTAYSTSDGIDLCVGSGKPNTASVSWLGNESFGFGGGIPANSTNALIQGKCAPSLSAPVRISMSYPYMHRLGKHLKSTISRAGGGETSLLDVAFNFAYTSSFSTLATLNPGDVINTTCTYDNSSAYTVGFGEAWTSEVCYDFVVASPANMLVGGGLQPSSCISP